MCALIISEWRRERCSRRRTCKWIPRDKATIIACRRLVNRKSNLWLAVADSSSTSCFSKSERSTSMSERMKLNCESFFYGCRSFFRCSSFYDVVFCAVLNAEMGREPCNPVGCEFKTISIAGSSSYQGERSLCLWLTLNKYCTIRRKFYQPTHPQPSPVHMAKCGNHAIPLELLKIWCGSKRGAVWTFYLFYFII